MKTYLSLFVFVALIFPSAAWSNSAGIWHEGVDGANIIPIKNHHIRMVREVVNIECAWTTYSVKADFWFKNTTNQNLEVEFGFPVDFKVDKNDDSIREYQQSFKVIWKGKPIKHYLEKRQHKISGQDDDFDRQWISWIARFAPNEEVYSRVSYTFPTCSQSGDSRGETETYAYLKYILRTGGAWKTPIESSKVIIHYKATIPGYLSYEHINNNLIQNPAPLKFYPKGYTWNKKKRTVTWEFKNFVPKADIFFGWGGVPDFKEADDVEKIKLDQIPVSSDRENTSDTAKSR